MPSGSGPQVTPLTAVVVPTAEGVVATLAPANWQSEAGNLVEFSALFTPPATGGTLTLRIRQGNAVAGTQIGSTWTAAATASVPVPVAISALDASAFGLAQQGGQYCVTAFYGTAGGTLSGVATLETVAPVL